MTAELNNHDNICLMYTTFIISRAHYFYKIYIMRRHITASNYRQEEQNLPFSDFKEDFRTDAALLGSVFHRETGPLQHVTALLLALKQGTRDLLRVQSMSL